MDVMQIRRMLLSTIGGGNMAKYVTGTFTPDTNITEKIVDFGVSTSSVKMVVLHMEGIQTLADVPNGTTLDIITILDPAYALNGYAGVSTPYYSCGMLKNASGTIVSSLYSRGNYSVGPTNLETTKWTFRPHTANVYFAANATYRWTAYL